MSDHQAGPGWWLASDGKWYPPELHPDAPKEPAPSAWAPPGARDATTEWGTPPDVPTAPAPWSMPPPMPPGVPSAVPAKRSPWPLAIGIVVILVIIGAVAALVTRSSHTSTSSSEASSSDTAASASLPPAASGTPALGPAIHNATGDVRLTLPTGWVGTDVEHGASGVGAELFPDDPAKAAAIEQRLSLLPRATVLFGIDSDQLGAGFTANVNVAADPTASASMSLDDLGRAEARGTAQFGAKVVDRDTIDLGGQPAYRFTYRANAFAGIAFVLKGSNSVWIAIYTFDSLSDTNEALADGSAATLVVP